MKVIAIFLGIALSNSALALDKVTENIQAVCLYPSQYGKYWDVTVKGGFNADGSVKLIAAGIKGEATFTKGEWEGIQQVLQTHQAGDNQSYRACVANVIPFFKGKFITPAAKSVTKTEPKTNPVSTHKAANIKSAPKETHKIVQTIGTQNAHKIVNINEMNGNLNMGQ